MALRNNMANPTRHQSKGAPKQRHVQTDILVLVVNGPVAVSRDPISRALVVSGGATSPHWSQLSLIDDDEDRVNLDRFIDAWCAAYGEMGLTARECISSVNAPGATESEKRLRQVMRDIAQGKTGGIDAHRLGTWMRRRARQSVNGRCIVRAGARDHTFVWKVKILDTS